MFKCLPNVQLALYEDYEYETILSCGAIPQDLRRTIMVSDWLKFNKLELKCQQW